MPRYKYNLLFVEDNEEEIQRFARNIEEFNENDDKEIRLNQHVVRTKQHAIERLKELRIDCAMIDLRISSEMGDLEDEKWGNATVNEIVTKYGMPVIIHSAFPGELSHNFDQLPLKVLTKEADSHNAAFDWLCDHAPLMRALSETRLRIRQQTAKIFFGSIWPRWENPITAAVDDDAMHTVISRQVVSFVSELLSLPGPESQAYHLQEYYFEPPLREDRLHTGDMIKWNGNLYVIVTPRCNISNNYPDNILLAKCDGFEENWRQIKRDIEETSNEQKRKRIRDKVRRWATQGVEISKHFLPPCGDKGPWMVDFKTVISVSSVNVDQLIEGRFASITPQFIPNLIQRWSSYMGRVGQPELDSDELVHHIMQG